MDQGRPAPADSLLARALTIQEEHPAAPEWRRSQARIARAWCLSQEGRTLEAQKVLGRLDRRSLWSSMVDRRIGFETARVLCEQWGWTDMTGDIGSEIDRMTRISTPSLNRM